MSRFDSIKNFISKNFAISGKRYSGFIQGRLPSKTTAWNSGDFLRANDISLYVNRALNKRADKVGEIEFEVRNTKGDIVENYPLLDLFSKPNKVFTGTQFWALAQKYYDLTGEVFIWMETGRDGPFDPKRVRGMHILMPIHCEPEFENGEIVKLKYKQPNAEEIVYDGDEILYVHNPDPQQPLRGQSLLRAGVNAIQTEIQISAYHSHLLENGGKVEGILKFKSDRINENQLKEIKDQYQKNFADARKSGRPLILGGDADYIKTGLSPDELSYMEAKKMTLEDICILTGVPKSMLASTNDVKFDNADADRAIFLRETVYPLLKMFATALDERVVPEGFTLIAVDPTPENTDKKLKEIENGIKNYYMTINEARDRQGLDPIEGGDEIMVPFSVMPLNQEPASMTPDESKQTAKRIREHIKAARPHPNRDDDVREVWGKMQIKRMDAREQKFERELNSYFDEQKTRLVTALQATNQNSVKKKNLFDEILQIGIEVKLGKELFLPVLTNLLREAGIDAMDFAGSEYAFNVSADIASSLERRAGVFLTKINETTFEELKKQFAESFSQEEDRKKLVKRIEDTYGNITKSRAKTIARTEVHIVTQVGTLEGYKQAGLTTKIWVAVLDDRTRESHYAIDGEERPIDVPFSNGLMLPGDPNGPAEEVINCRCVL